MSDLPDRITEALEGTAPEPCPYCDGTCWIDDANWQPDDPRAYATGRLRRSPWDGRLPCPNHDEAEWYEDDGTVHEPTIPHRFAQAERAHLAALLAECKALLEQLPPSILADPSRLDATGLEIGQLIEWLRSDDAPGIDSDQTVGLAAWLERLFPQAAIDAITGRGSDG